MSEYACGITSRMAGTEVDAYSMWCFVDRTQYDLRAAPGILDERGFAWKRAEFATGKIHVCHYS